jgi:hypothetical protein
MVSVRTGHGHEPEEDEMARTIDGMVNEMVKRNLLEDRREYTVDDLRSAYDLTTVDATALHRRIAEVVAGSPLRDARVRTMDLRWMRDMDDATLGARLREYFEESQHGSWEGFERQDLTGIRKLVTDAQLFVENYE